MPTCYAQVSGAGGRPLRGGGGGGSKAAQQQPDEELRVVCRGFRVRMGLHSGLDSDQHVMLNKVGISSAWTHNYMSCWVL